MKPPSPIAVNMASEQPVDSSSAAPHANRVTLPFPPRRESRTSESSSDDGYRMSPAAARRFARRHMRRTSPTPDLVTSLVRPPSPDTFYVAGQMHQNRPTQSGRGAHVDHRSQTSGVRRYRSGLGRASSSAMAPHLSSLDLPKKYGGECVFDMYALTYASEPDSALMCPICHDPLVDPITTPCDHTFCYRCIRRSIASSPSGTACPVDRDALSWSECAPAGRLIRTQLNALLVTCPHRNRGCSQELRRDFIESHATNECRFRDYACPDPDCDKRLRQKPANDKCHHYMTSCRYCEEEIQAADNEMHMLSCTKAKTRCEACWELVPRSSMETHHKLDCDGAEVACTYQDVGCAVQVERGQLADHLAECPFHPETASGVVIRSQRDTIQSYGDLAREIERCRLDQQETSRRLDEMSTTIDRRGPGETVVNDNRTIQDLDAGFEEVHQNLTHLEARQSMWTLNQVMPIREEVTELRNNINMIRMHVNWLLNRSREEGRIRAANNSSSSGSIRRENGADSTTIPILPERRRSSGTDMDLPRL